MNALIDPLKRIARDLVEKRLWPVAALLLAAIVAVPMLIGSSAEPPAPAPAATAAVAPEAKSLVTVVDPAESGSATRPGEIRDPFYDPPEAPEETVAAAADTAPVSSRGAAPTAATSGPKQAVQPPPPAAPTPRAPVRRSGSTAAKGSYHRTMVQWYETRAGASRPLARLTPLGGAAHPAALFLGITKSKGTYAMFLLAPGVTSHGDGTCENETNCRMIGLKAGETQVVTLPPAADGRSRQLRLKVTSVKSIETDAATARERRAHVHADGRKAMREMWQDRPTAEALGPIRYDEPTGLLFKVPAAAKQDAK